MKRPFSWKIPSSVTTSACAWFCGMAAGNGFYRLGHGGFRRFRGIFPGEEHHQQRHRRDEGGEREDVGEAGGRGHELRGGEEDDENGGDFHGCWRAGSGCSGEEISLP